MPSSNQGILRVSIKPKGAWTYNMYYDRLDLVNHNGAAYLAVSPSQSVEPSMTQGWQTYWMLIAQSASIEGAQQLYQQAVKSVDAVKNMSVSVEEVDPTETASAEKTYDARTGTLNILFKIPIGQGAIVTYDTVTADVLFQGYTAHNANGDQITGTYQPDVSQTNYVVGSANNFTLLASNWNGTTYNLDLSAYPTVSQNIVIGVPINSSMYNATLMAEAALSIAQVSIGDTSATARISAVNQPTEDILISIWGF